MVSVSSSRYRRAVAAYYRSLFLNVTLPGGVVGDVHRGVSHGRDIGDVGRALRAVVLERFAGQVVQVLLTVIVLLALPSPVQSSMPLVATVVAVAVVGVVLVARLRPDGSSAWARVRCAARRDIRDALLTQKARVGIVLASALVVAGHAVTFLIAARTAGATASPMQMLPIALLAMIAMVLPSAGGWGPREGVAAWAFGAAGLGAQRGVATGVVYGVMVVVASLAGRRSPRSRTGSAVPECRSDGRFGRERRMPDRPYTLLSCGMSIDGYLGSAAPRRLELSNDADFDRVDAVRASCDAIMVGAATVRIDNPRLLVRSRNRREARTVRGLPPSPMKVTVSERLELDPRADFFTTGDVEKLVYCTSPRLVDARSRLEAVATVVDGGRRVKMRRLTEDLGERGVRRLMVEGGGKVHTQFLTDGLVDELQLVVAPFFVGDSRATRFVSDGHFPWNPDRRAELAEVRQIGDVVLLRYALSTRFQRD